MSLFSPRGPPVPCGARQGRATSAGVWGWVPAGRCLFVPRVRAEKGIPHRQSAPTRCLDRLRAVESGLEGRCSLPAPTARQGWAPSRGLWEAKREAQLS